MAIRSVACFIVLLIVAAEAVIFQDCGSTAGKFNSITISGCSENAAVCPLIRKTNATITIDFEVNAESSNLTAEVHGKVLGVEVPFPLPNPDGCKDSGLECPLKPNTKYQYITTLPILAAYPKVSVEIKWELKSSSNEDVVCMEFPAKIR